MRAAKAQTSLRTHGKSPAPNCPQTHRRNACRGCEFKISKALDSEFALFTTRL